MLRVPILLLIISTAGFAGVTQPLSCESIIVSKHDIVVSSFRWPVGGPPLFFPSKEEANEILRKWYQANRATLNRYYHCRSQATTKQAAEASEWNVWEIKRDLERRMSAGRGGKIHLNGMEPNVALGGGVILHFNDQGASVDVYDNRD